MDKVRRILVTGAAGFIGKNLVLALGRSKETEVLEFDLETPAAALSRALNVCDAVVHLAGVNRPKDDGEFESGNVGSLAAVLSGLEQRDHKPLVVLASSKQASLDSPYGRSKLKAERLLSNYAEKTGAPIGILRLPGVFGKWCRPNYNSVVATFCHNIAHGLPITISDPAIGLDVVHIDDVVKCILDTLAGESRVGSDGFFHAEPQFHISLGDLARKLRDFHADRQTLIVPDLSDRFTRCLYSTYVSYLPADGFSHALERREDARGALAEILKSRSFGQIFISRTRPGVERGNHYHDTKVEKFAVLDGEAVIRFRDIRSDEMIEYPVSGREFKVLDIPPGYTHSIENVGSTELIVLFWAYEPYDPGRPDTFPLPVRKERTP